ncbi:uncharacterized protein NDAI_0D02590 [Naumovozyma dairenensis CBS 421]|uniref:Uncharacterized protein n=1 Tax=Naumovozyma dairenensis (strain ATCC 10597 / BCRC 20456 / CBS 421 / NBRC 0211 / NRRL Y-12639) TaxID=1071378 RepID=G0W9W2_NAUDC|nr:hypothetical protein NDAI_0D02590 [Naumovozyma dairenensis CBS 421]CCD24573.1 hypothetical protein NDAI_0D02590 [Naumovozyma dairenensis CBS 421]
MATPKFIKHISFDDLSPSLVDSQATELKKGNYHIGLNNHFIHIPPQYNPLYKTRSTLEDQSSDSEQRETRPIITDVEHQTYKPKSQMQVPTMYSHLFNDKVDMSTSLTRSRSESPMQARRRQRAEMYGAKLPPPPSKPVLRKDSTIHFSGDVDDPSRIEDIDIADLDAETEMKMTKITQDNTAKNSGSKHGYTQELFSNLNEVEDRIENRSRRASVDDPDKKRTKSFAGMSDEELAQLENFYISKGRSNKSNLTDYDFGEQASSAHWVGDKGSSNGNIPVLSKTMYDSLTLTYPSRPSVNYRAISMTSQHSDFESYLTRVKEELASKEKESLTALRTVCCYISGRRFTWSTLDWFVENMAKDGDHLVIMTVVPEFEELVEKSLHSIYKERINSTGSSPSLTRSGASSFKESKNESKVSTGLYIEAIYEEARKKCREILDYYVKRLVNKNKIMRVTIEMVKNNSSKKAVSAIEGLYKPSFQLFSTVSTNIQIKFRNGYVKFPFFIMKHFFIPVFIIPFEFIDPHLLMERDEENQNTTKTSDNYQLKRKDRLKWLDNLIAKTLKNPFSTAAVDSKPVASDDEELSDNSVTGYFPVSKEQKYKIDLFERMGYVRPVSSRALLLQNNDIVFDKDGKKITQTSSRTSRRSSRIQFNDGGIYKVKSLIDGADMTHDSGKNYDNINRSSKSNEIRKTKSSASGTLHHHDHLLPTVSPSYGKLPRVQNGHMHLAKVKSSESQKTKHKNVRGTSTSKTSTSKTPTTSKPSEKKKSKKSFGSMFKKVFSSK